MIGSPKPTFLLEQAPRGGASGESRTREYLIASAQKTSTLEKEIQTAAADGYRAVGAGFMIVVMEREAGGKSVPLDYQVLAMIRASTGERELNVAGAEGFKLILSPEAARQGCLSCSAHQAQPSDLPTPLPRPSPKRSTTCWREPRPTGTT